MNKNLIQLLNKWAKAGVVWSTLLAISNGCLSEQSDKDQEALKKDLVDIKMEGVEQAEGDKKITLHLSVQVNNNKKTEVDKILTEGENINVKFQLVNPEEKEGTPDLVPTEVHFTTSEEATPIKEGIKVKEDGEIQITSAALKTILEERGANVELTYGEKLKVNQKTKLKLIISANKLFPNGAQQSESMQQSEEPENTPGSLLINKVTFISNTKIMVHVDPTTFGTSEIKDPIVLKSILYLDNTRHSDATLTSVKDCTVNKDNITITAEKLAKLVKTKANVPLEFTWKKKSNSRQGVINKKQVEKGQLILGLTLVKPEDIQIKGPEGKSTIVEKEVRIPIEMS